MEVNNASFEIFPKIAVTNDAGNAFNMFVTPQGHKTLNVFTRKVHRASFNQFAAVWTMLEADSYKK